MKNNKIHIFFACDDGYVPFLAVALTSLRENANKRRSYAIKILNTGISECYKERIKNTFSAPKFSIDFVDVSEAVESISEKLHTRDYYSKSTYYRLFIPNLFPDVDKALYLDGDIVLTGDVSKLYDTELCDNLVGAVHDSFVGSVDILKSYVTNRVGVDSSDDYFNAGVLVMNLKAMREMDFEKVFINLVGAVKFDVAQDQDYLNVICRGRCTHIGYEWNCMPGFTSIGDAHKLIHYNLDNKPWKKKVPYGNYFWEYAIRSGFEQEILAAKKKCTRAVQKKAAEETKNLCTVAYGQAMDKRENRRIKREICRIVG